jgi:hypothetical protein
MSFSKTRSETHIVGSSTWSKITKVVINYNSNLPIVMLISLLVVIRLIPELSKPYFSWIGDEWSFYEVALRISKAKLLINPFAQGAHGYCSQLVSFYNALFMFLFGYSIFWWKFSSIFLLIPTTTLLYIWVSRLYDNRVALYSSCIFCFSFCFQNFYIFGYGNQLTFIPFLLLNIILTFLLDDNKKYGLLHMFSAGTVLGIGFYFYIGIILPFVYFPYLAYLSFRSGFYFALKHAIGSLLFSLIWLTPLTVDSLYASSLLDIVIFHNSNFQLIERVPTILSTFTAFFYSTATGYFVSGAFIDKLSSILLALGLLYAIFNIQKLNSNLVILMLFLSLLSIFGMSHKYSEPPIQHCFILIAITSIFSGLGLAWLSNQFSKPINRFVPVVLLSLIALANQYRRELSVYNQGISPEACLLTNIHSIKQQQPAVHDIYVDTNVPAYIHTVSWLLPLYGIYDVQLIDKNSVQNPISSIKGATLIELNNITMKSCRDQAVPKFLLDSFSSTWTNYI